MSWEKWAARCCNWMLSIPKRNNPSMDMTGNQCSCNQVDENVWFLTGTFGNMKRIRRKCTIPSHKAIFFPILEKEDSFAEDTDLTKEIELVTRSQNAMDRVMFMEAYIDSH